MGTLFKTTQAPAGQILRPGQDSWTRATNAQQRRLVRAYDLWAKGLQREIEHAVAMGLGQSYIEALLERQLPALEASLSAITKDGIIGAAHLSMKSKALPPRVSSIATRHMIDNDLLIKETLIPHLRKNLAEKLAQGVASDRVQLAQALTALRNRPAQYAGGYWLMIFETQREVGLEREAGRRRAGDAVEPVRWDLDPGAEHCHSSPGFYGCVELAGEYPGGWGTLPTVPAGQVTCRGNCRCRISVYIDGQWRRGLT